MDWKKKTGKCHLTMDGLVGKFCRVVQRVRHADNVNASYFSLYFFPKQGKCVGPYDLKSKVLSITRHHHDSWLK